jgi:uncharacterized protein (TIGR03437 family)
MPVLSEGLGVPFTQTSGGITAQFSSPSGPAYAIQTAATTGWKFSRFSGKFLTPNNVNRNVLEIRFNPPLTGISFVFATGDTEIEVPSTIQLTAYSGSAATPPVGVASTHGRYGSDTMPMGSLTFNSTAAPFNLVQITIPFQPGSTNVFLIDNISVSPGAASRVLSSVCAASYMSGAPLAPNSIASGFGQGMSAGTESAPSAALPTVLANTFVTVKDSAGAERRAPLFFVAPTQINYLVPEGTARGPATVTVTSAGQVTASGMVTVDAVAPGLFTANFDGRGAPAAAAITAAPDFTQTVQAVARCGSAAGSCVPSPIDLGPEGTLVVLTLYGTGIRGRSAPAAVTARIGNMAAPVYYAGPQSEFPGLDQVNVLIPRALAGRGETDLLLTVDGMTANPVRVHIK